MSDVPDEQMGEAVPTRTQVIAHGPAYLYGRPLGQILMQSFGLTQEKLDEGLKIQAEKGGRLGEVLVGMKAVGEEDVTRSLAAQLDLPYLAVIGIDDVDPELVKQVPINFAKQHGLIPLKAGSDAVAIAIADPLDTAVLDHARMLLQRDVAPSIASLRTVVDAINQVYDRSVNEAEQV